MHTVKNAAATAKEKIANVGAKGDLKKDEVKISAQEKAGKAMASDKLEKQQVKAEKHAKEADAIREKEEKKAENAIQKDMSKDGLATKKAAAQQAYSDPTTVAPGNAQSQI